MKVTSRSLLVVILLFGVCAHAAQAQTDPSAEEATASATAASSDSLWTRDTITGDWGGSRTKLTELGLDMEFRFSQFYQDVTSGGVDSSGNGAYGLKFNTWVNIDAHKLFGTWEGLYIAANIESRAGNDVLADAGGFVVPNAPLLYPSPGDYTGTQVTSFMVSQVLAGGKAALVAGKLGSLDLLQGLFPNGIVDYGLDGFMSANSIMSILSWGRWLTLSQYGVSGWTIKHGMPSTGFIVAGATNTSTTWSTKGAFSDGVGLMLFHRFVYDIDGKDGYVYIGGGGSTKSYNSLDPVDWTDLPGEGPVNTATKKPWGVAVYWYQILAGEKGSDKKRVQLFSGLSVADNNPSFADFDIFASIQSFGPFATRPDDRWGIAGHYYHLGDDFVDLVSLLPSEDLRSNTWSFELYYNYQITPWLHLTPSIQYAQNQNRNDDPAFIPGLRLVMDF
jgi:porin